MGWLLSQGCRAAVGLTVTLFPPFRVGKRVWAGLPLVWRASLPFLGNIQCLCPGAAASTQSLPGPSPPEGVCLLPALQAADLPGQCSAVLSGR